MAAGVLLDPPSAVALDPSAFSAHRVELDEPRRAARGADDGGKAVPWQREASYWLRTLGEVSYACTWFGSALARMDWGVARGPKRAPVRSATTGEVVPELNPQMVAAAERHMADLLGRQGTQADWSWSLGTSLASCAEGWMVGYWANSRNEPVPETDQSAEAQVWESVGPLNISRGEAKGPGDGQRPWQVRRSENGEFEKLPSDAVAVRIWRGDPDYPDDAFGPMRALGDVCSDLQATARAIRASTLSRVPAGILLIPAEALAMPLTRAALAMATTTGGDQRPVDPVVKELVAGMVTPGRDPGSASILVPTVITTKGDVIDKWRHLKMGREVDPKSLERETALLRRFAQGMDVPAEVILGLAALNHWTAWLVTEAAFKNHLEPTMLLVGDGLTVGYLWPALRADGFAPAEFRQLRAAGDPADVIEHPDPALAANDAFDRGAISWPAYRRARGFEEDDAPDEEELRQRAMYGYSRRVPGSFSPVDAGNQEAGPAESEQPGATILAEAFGDNAATIEHSLVAALTGAADGALESGLRRAANKLRTACQKRSGAQWRELVRTAQGVDVVKLLGPAGVAALTGDDGLPGLLVGAWDSLRERSTALFASSLEWWDHLAAEFGLILSEPERAERSANVAAAVEVLVVGVQEQAIALMEGRAATPDGGERAAGALHHVDAVRDACCRAGGGGIGLFAGSFMAAAAAAHGMRPTGLRWVYGLAPRRMHYPGHLELDHCTLASPDNGDRPPAPGEVPGCLCAVAFVLVPGEVPSTPSG